MHITITTISLTGWKLKLWFISFHFTHPWLLWASCLLNGSLEKFPHFYILFSWLLTIPAHWGFQVQLQRGIATWDSRQTGFSKNRKPSGTGPILMDFHSPQCQPPGTRQPLSPLHKGGGGAKSLFVLFPRGGQAMGENRELLSLGYIWSSWDWFCQENNHSFTGWKAPALQTHWLVLWEDAGGSPPETCTHGVPRNRHHLIYPLHFSSLVGGKRGLRSSA